MKKNTADQKIDDFFRKFCKKASNGSKISKTAAISRLKDIDDAKMIREMLALPKYDPIKKQLMSANGLVNLVTYDEYGPLVEVLLKLAYPPSSNATYDMGAGEDVGGGFMVADSKTFFGDFTGTAKEIKDAQFVLDQILRGTTKKKDLEWYQNESGLDDDEIARLINPAPDASGAMTQGMAFAAYHEAAGRVEKNKNTMEALRQERKKLLKSLDEKGPRGEVLPPDRILEIQTQIDNVNAKVKNLHVTNINEMRVADARYGKHLIIRNPDGTAQRNDDGLLNFDPMKELNLCFLEIGKAIKGKTNMSDLSMEKIPTIAKEINTFYQKLSEYNTSDPATESIKQQILDKIGNGNLRKEEVTTYHHNMGTHSRLWSAFKEKAKGQGRVLIFDDFERSPLCLQTAREDTPFQLNDGGVFNSFLATLRQTQDERSTKSLRGGEESSDGTSVLLLSSSPIGGLPVNKKIHMDRSPVDLEEAKIIVSNILEQYAMEARKILTRRLNSELDEKFEGKESNEDRTAKATEKMALLKNIKQQSIREGRVSTNVSETIEQMITGMGQGTAINTVQNVVASAVERSVNEETGYYDSLSIDEDVLISGVTVAANEILSEDTLGISIIQPHVKYQNYAYKSLSTWGKRIPELGNAIEGLELKRQEINAAMEEVRRINSQLMSKKLDANSRTILESEHKMWTNQVAALNIEKNEILEGIPVSYLLYGPRGVGKSAWAEALCSLMGHKSLRNVDIGAQKDKWVGNTPKNATRLFKNILNSRDTVFLIDEIDRQLEQSEGGDGSGSSEGGHETTKDIVKRLLDFFELAENQSKMKENRVVCVLTSNYIGDVDSALQSRISETHEVFIADEPEDYKMLLTSIFETLQSKRPSNPMFAEEGVTEPEEGWKSAIKFFYDNVDVDAVANAMSKKSLNYRLVTQLITSAISYQVSYRNSIQLLGKGQGNGLYGLPLTTANIVEAVGYADAGLSGNADYKAGMIDVVLARSEELKKMMEGRELNAIEVDHPILKDKDPITGEFTIPRKVIKYVVPEDVVKFMRGEITPDGQPKELFNFDQGGLVERTPQQKMEDLMGGFDEGSPDETEDGEGEEVVPVEEDVTQKRKPRTKKETAPVPSEPTEKELEVDKEASTLSDYLFSYLQSKGILTKEGQLQNKLEQDVNAQPSNNINPPSKEPEEAEEDGQNVESNEGQDGRFIEGVYNLGWIMIAPATADAPAQRVKRDLGNNNGNPNVGRGI